MFCALLGHDQVSVYRTIGPLVVISFFYESHVSKLNSPRWDAEF